jgi:putative MFS transporter
MTNIGPRLDRLPSSRFHYRLLRLIGFGMFFDGFEIYMTSVVAVPLVQAGWFTVGEIARFASAMFFGLALGALVAGRLGDLYGRKTMYQVNLLIYSLGALLCACAPNLTMLLALRVLTGFGLGAEIVIGYSMFAEFIPARSRGWWAGLLAVITNSAQPASALAGLLIIPTLGWRWMFVVAGIPALFIWWYRRSLPESPRWYEQHGDTWRPRR